MEPHIIKIYITKSGQLSLSEQEQSFYAINPNFRPIPPGSNLFGYGTSLRVINDPLDYQPEIRFIAWVEPVPYTTPLYAYTNIGGVSTISFQKSDMQQLYFSPIYVLTDYRDGRAVVSQYKSDNRNFRIVNDRPLFRFTGYQGRCLPDPNGKSLSECTILYVNDIDRTTDANHTLRTYIGNRYSSKTDYILITIISVISVIFFLYLFRKYFRKDKEK